MSATLISPLLATGLAASGLALPLAAGAALFAVLSLLLIALPEGPPEDPETSQAPATPEANPGPGSHQTPGERHASHAAPTSATVHAHPTATDPAPGTARDPQPSARDREEEDQHVH
ncbi:hypothetical protein [Nocardiopsis sp. CNR-923]|uniref:hypothetical protein n=1 Tax=Nocardiopsis sp. CNR-923 TaxID=1904965 RepID=UPI00117F13CB|nr:hypothetical protein [Nocardiopsis sp. CNR-923]